MKITKHRDEVLALQKARENANIGCNVCPCCGEGRSARSVQGGISHTERTWAAGFFTIKHMKVDCYRCWTCGAEWESDPYEYC